MSSFSLSPLSLEDLPSDDPDSPVPPDPDSPLSTLSPRSSFETMDANYSVQYSWSGGRSARDHLANESNEFGQEVTVINEASGQDAQDVPRETSRGSGMNGATPTGFASSRYEDTPRAGTANRYDDTPRAGTANRFEDTPKAGTASSNIGQRQNGSKQQRLSIATGRDDENQHLSTPSWDIDQTFSFRKNQENKKSPYHLPQRSQSSFSGLWDFMSAIGLSRSESMAADEDGAALKDDNSNEMDGPPGFTESTENDLFAMEVGLMFSTDEGDTINDPTALYDQTFSASFTIESESSAPHSPAYDLAKYLKYRRENASRSFDDAAGHDESTIYTAGQSTIRDDHGNKVPENSKMILGYENVKRLKTASERRHKQATQAFPTVQNTDAAPDEMERRLRELAGQISADWRGPTFMPPTLARRLRDFQFAREKRRKKYGKAKPWGILGLYDHLSSVKIDVGWAEDAAHRRTNKDPYLTWADYEENKNQGFNRPLFTFLIVSICTAMMITSMHVNDWKFEPLSVNPMLGPSAETLLRLGAKDSYLIVVQQEIWRLVSPMVLHAGLIHFFLNMFALWFVGKAIEQIHGFFPAVIQFVVPAIGGTILSAIFLPEYITVGASGGIFGLIGAAISDIIMNWNLLFNEFVNERGARLSHARVLIVLFLDIVLNCLIGLTPFVDNFTHLGGMIYGFLCGLSTIHWYLHDSLGRQRSHKCKLLFFRSFGLLVCMAGIIASSIVLFSGDGETNPCTSCTHMSCVAFPPWNDKNEKWWYCDDCSQASAEGTLDTATGKFIELNIKCPSGSTETIDVDESWPQSETGLEGMLPMLCREHCLW
ncbi:LOW QUALITY PROTEIN: hypothetical protein ACHAXR_009109 [Thalassiosira sp. AJA248-18]